MNWDYDSMVLDAVAIEVAINVCMETFSGLATVKSVKRMEAFVISPNATIGAVAGPMLDKWVQDLWAKHETSPTVHGMSASLIHGDRILGVESRGFADATHKSPMTDSTVSCAGSLGKIFTSLLAMKLVQDNVASWDASLSILPAPLSEMTLRQLLLMTAGLPRDLDESASRTYTNLWAAIADSVEPADPRTVYCYSNLSYSVAGYALTMLATGEKDFEKLPALFAELLTRLVLVPLGLPHASVMDYVSPPLTKAQYNSACSTLALPCGAVQCSITDLAQLVMAELSCESGMGLEPAQYAARYDTSHNWDKPWGMGWVVDKSHAHGYIYMSGGWDGTYTGVKIDPNTGWGMAFVVNTTETPEFDFSQLMELSMDTLFWSVVGRFNAPGTFKVTAHVEQKSKAERNSRGEQVAVES
jgi:CubicO group peptidase (beta-lactamase class C family)